MSSATLTNSLRRALPTGLATLGRTGYLTVASVPARRAFDRAPLDPEWLPPDVLPVLERQAPTPASYGYDAQSLARRGVQRAQRLSPLVKALRRPRTLEIGCGDAMVSAALAEDGAAALALDLTPALFDDRARSAGVALLEGDAAAIPLDDRSCDLVFSYNSFEHFSDPARVLAEAVRVVRSGGLIYLNFGPLYFSPYGLHAALSIRLPYCHLLFERPALERYVDARDLKPIPFETLNEWSVTRFRELWADVRGDCEIRMYREMRDVHGLELIRRFPSVFRAKTDTFDDLAISQIEIVLERRM
jgi:SAM-dependent methyltransferase